MRVWHLQKISGGVNVAPGVNGNIGIASVTGDIATREMLVKHVGCKHHKHKIMLALHVSVGSVFRLWIFEVVNEAVGFSGDEGVGYHDEPDGVLASRSPNIQRASGQRESESSVLCMQNPMRLMKVEIEYKQQIARSLGENGVEADRLAENQHEVEEVTAKVESEGGTTRGVHALLIDDDLRATIKQFACSHGPLFFETFLHLRQLHVFDSHVFVAQCGRVRFPGGLAKGIEYMMLGDSVVRLKLIGNVVEQQRRRRSISISARVKNHVNASFV